MFIRKQSDISYGYYCSNCEVWVVQNTIHICLGVQEIASEPSVDERILSKLKQIEKRLEKIEKKA